MPVQMMSVKSSNIVEIGYDAELEELHVSFKSGGMYVYSAVNAELHSSLMASDSIGSELHKKIKLGKFKYRKV